MTKRLTSLVLIVTLMFGGIIVPDSSAVQAASKADNAKKQYKKILRSVNGNADFWCYDINHDGVLELLLNEVSGSGISKLYYYHKNKLKKSDVSSYFACYKKGGVFSYYTSHSGHDYEGYFVISNGKIKEIASTTDDSGAGYDSAEGPQYYIGKKKVSKSKFNSYIRGKTQNSKSMEPKWHAVTKTNIIKYVK